VVEIGGHSIQMKAITYQPNAFAQLLNSTAQGLAKITTLKKNDLAKNLSRWTGLIKAKESPITYRFSVILLNDERVLVNQGFEIE
jgi:hypothetical protein